MDEKSDYMVHINSSQLQAILMAILMSGKVVDAGAITVAEEVAKKIIDRTKA